MNPASKSKINFVQLISAFVGIAVVAGFVPVAMEENIITIAMIGVPVLTAVLRTWFTGNAE